MTSPTPIRLGTRASALARWQADWVAAQLKRQGTPVEIVLITTQGDVQTGPLSQGGGVGLFTKEIQRALLDDKIDLAVHSLKDLPTEEIPGLLLAAVPPREKSGDALVSSKFKSLSEISAGAKIGTGSARRRAQLLHARPDLIVEEIRGNVDTRLRKLDEGEYDAIVLAEAGLIRLGLAARIAEVIDRRLMFPAVGQGALGLECRAHDARTRQALIVLDDGDSHAAVLAERSMLAALRGGCLAPVGAWGRVEGDRLHLDGVVLSPDGVKRLHVADSAALDEAVALGSRVAAQLLRLGAAELIAQGRK